MKEEERRGEKEREGKRGVRVERKERKRKRGEREDDDREIYEGNKEWEGVFLPDYYSEMCSLTFICISIDIATFEEAIYLSSLLCEVWKLECLS